MIRYRVADLISRPLRRQVRFVAVDHPTRGKILLLSTDLALDPIDVIRLYGIRFKIELSFKQALRVVGVYAYHFWMMTMKPRLDLCGRSRPWAEAGCRRQSLFVHQRPCAGESWHEEDVPQAESSRDN
jgi:hypothetical protein